MSSDNLIYFVSSTKLNISLLKFHVGCVKCMVNHNLIIYSTYAVYGNKIELIHLLCPSFEQTASFFKKCMFVDFLKYIFFNLLQI